MPISSSIMCLAADVLGRERAWGIGAARCAGSEATRLRKLRPIIEASEPSTQDVAVVRYVACARPTGGSHGRIARGLAQRRGGAKREAAFSNLGEAEQRGQQHTHYKGRSPCVRMHSAPATSAGTPRRLRAQEPRPATSIKAGALRTLYGALARFTSAPLRAVLLAPPLHATGARPRRFYSGLYTILQGNFREFLFHALTNYLKTLTIGYHRR